MFDLFSDLNQFWYFSIVHNIDIPETFETFTI